MLDWTDRHARYFMRLASRRCLLYTEMITTGALIHGDAERFLAYDPAEHPLALQLGGSKPEDLAHCVRLAADLNYDEVNLNLGCPSNRVQSGLFGACLMAEPARVADCLHAMRAAADIPITIKCRIGIDELDSYDYLQRFIDCQAATGCRTVIIHARKAILSGLSPKENRDIPPLDYPRVYQIKRDFPALEIIINGGITSLEDCLGHLQYTDGVMVGREAYHNPYLLADVDRVIHGDDEPGPSRAEMFQAYLPYVQQQLDQDVRLSALSRHILGLFQGQPGARAFRRHISERAHRPGAGVEVLEQAFAHLRLD